MYKLYKKCLQRTSSPSLYCIWNILRFFFIKCYPHKFLRLHLFSSILFYDKIQTKFELKYVFYGGECLENSGSGRYKRIEYEFEIDGYSGAIRSWEVESIYD